MSPDSILAIAKHASENSSKKFCFNLSAPFISQFFGDRLMATLPYVDILFGNETEAQAFAKLNNWPENASSADIATRIAKLDKVNKQRERIVVITQGADNIVVVTQSGNKVEEIAPTKLTREQIVDTNGAGDAFVGGFLSQLALGRGLEACVAAGTYAATEIIQLSGCTFPAENKYQSPM